MMLARGITRFKWEKGERLAAGELPADAVTGDLRTRDNRLSFWRCAQNGQDRFEDAAMAIAAARDDLDKVEIVLVDDEELREDGQTLEDSGGNTPVSEMVERHVDVCRLDHVRLGRVARRVARAIRRDDDRRFTRARVRRLLASGVRSNRLELADLREKLRSEVHKSLVGSGARP